MKKLSKIILFSLFALLVCGSLALALCYIIIPERTKYAIDIVVEYANKPLGVVCGTTITLGLVAGVIIKLIYDRYKATINEKLEQAKAFNSETVVKAKEYYEKGLKVREEQIAYLSNFGTRIDNLTEKLVKVCETSPNAKIKALGEEIKNSDINIAQELDTKLGEIENLALEETESLLKRIEELESIVKKVASKYENEE